MYADWDDDARGFRKKKGPLAQLNAHKNKIYIVIILLMSLGLWWQHSHKKTLAKQIDHHLKDKENLQNQVKNTDEHIKSKTRELNEVMRAHREVAHSITEHQTKAQRLEGDHAECMHQLRDEQHRSHVLDEEVKQLKHQVESNRVHYEGVIRNNNARISELENLLHGTVHGKAGNIDLHTTHQHDTHMQHQQHQDSIPKPSNTNTAAAGGQVGVDHHNVHEDVGHHHEEHHEEHQTHDEHHQQHHDEHQIHEEHHPDTKNVHVDNNNNNNNNVGRRWGRPDPRQQQQQQQQHNEPATPANTNRRKGRGGRRRGSSMLEEHLGVEHHEG